MAEENPVVFTYDYEVSIGGPPPQSIDQARGALNKAWGFEDGRCNMVNSDGHIVAKPGADDPALQEAFYSMARHTRICIEVSLHKDGHKTFRLKT